MRKLLLVVVWLGGACVGAADGWPRFGGPAGTFSVPGPAGGEGPAWKRPFGVGTSGVVGDARRLYTMYALPREAGTAAREVTAALDFATGRTVWEGGVDVELLAKQESFGGAPMQPQATPVLYAGKVFTLGFTGILQARDAETGKLVWRTDLVADYQADPVQYGFAASPVVLDGRLVVHAGGRHAVLAFDPSRGDVLWKTEAAAPSYATPVGMCWDNLNMVVQLTRDALFGFEAGSGRTLWKYPLPKPGLTNVPTPLALSDGRVLVSGQGLDGTRLLRLRRQGGAVAVDVVWAQPKAQFFYSNWSADESTVYGFPNGAGKRLLALDLRDGAILWKESNQTDANVIVPGDRALVCRGDGLLSLGRFGREGFKVEARGQPVAGRCWVPPALIGTTLIVRAEAELAAVPLATLTSAYRARADAGRTALERAFADPEPPTRVGELQAVLSKDGKSAMLDRYRKQLADTAIRFTETDFAALTAVARKSPDADAAAEVTADWMRRFPNSSAAYDARRAALVALARPGEVAALDAARLVPVRFVVRAGSVPEPNSLYLSGNCAALGAGKPDGVKLAANPDGTFGAEVKLPTGECKFKVTRGTRKTAESNRHGGTRGPRTLLIVGATTVEVDVLGWVDAGRPKAAEPTHK